MPKLAFLIPHDGTAIRVVEWTKQLADRGAKRAILKRHDNVTIAFYHFDDAALNDEGHDQRSGTPSALIQQSF